jgi:hypothetical protein
MNQNNKISILALATIAIIGTGVLSVISFDNTEVTTNDTTKTGKIVVHNSYTTTDLSKMKDMSQDIVKGIIVDKYPIIQYRDADGNYVEKDSSEIAETEPYIVYEVKNLQSIKAKNDSHQIYKFKTLGGELNGFTVISEMPEYNIGDTVIVLLHESFDGEYQELVAGEYGIYKLSDKKAINAYETISEDSLFEKLQ